MRTIQRADHERVRFVGEFNGDGLHGRLWGVAREVMGSILEFLRFGALNLFSTKPGVVHE
jgi:hypothetical protein